jgi:3-oxoacyl-[acyl-carrier-protein] synthase II
LRRVVVTGLGAITPLGNSVKNNWESLLQNKSGIKKITKFNVDGYPCTIAGTIEDSLIDEQIISQRDQRRNDRFITLGIIAANEAYLDAGFNPNEEEANRYGVIIGSGIGGLDSIYKNSLILNDQGIRKISPFFIPSSLINLTSGQVSIKYGLKGPNSSPVTACATGTHAIGDSFTLIKNNKADLMICGGSEAAVCPIGMAGFSAARALCDTFNDNPESGSRPWDKKRSGFVMGEGDIYGEIKGYGLSGDAFHITKPSEDGNGGFRAMEMAVKESELSLEDIQYINAHGTSTPVGDLIELSAVERMFENHKNIFMNSNKSAIGHLLGAAGAVEAVFTLKSIQNSILPATLNLDEPERETFIDLVPNTPKEAKIKNAISNSFGFGGTNASLVIGTI